mmetsp:Transcript_27746/g.70307  ORF Transcript_27746/g.70307 Transcript_27746/m.70307 type:complete len:283 (+) Transcript_27746:52-900(+)
MCRTTRLPQGWNIIHAHRTPQSAVRAHTTLQSRRPSASTTRRHHCRYHRTHMVQSHTVESSTYVPARLTPGELFTPRAHLRLAPRPTPPPLLIQVPRSVCREDTLQLVSPFHAPMASSERRHLLDSSWPQCWMMPASFSHGSEIATTVSCCLACRFAMPLSLATSLSTAALTALLWGSFTSLALAMSFRILRASSWAACSNSLRCLATLSSAALIFFSESAVDLCMALHRLSCSASSLSSVLVRSLSAVLTVSSNSATERCSFLSAFFCVVVFCLVSCCITA